jgi:hypothetical protein
LARIARIIPGDSRAQTRQHPDNSKEFCDGPNSSSIEPQSDGRIDYSVRLVPQGDQARRRLDRIVLFPRILGGRGIERVTIDGNEHRQFTRDSIVLAGPW